MARGKVDGLARRPRLHAHDKRRRKVIRRRSADLRRSRLHVHGALRPRGPQPARLRREGPGQAAAGRGDGSAHDRHDPAGAVLTRRGPPRQRADLSAAPAAGRARRGRLRRRVGSGYQARHDGGPRTLRARRVHARPRDVVHSQSPLLAEGRRGCRPPLSRFDHRRDRDGAGRRDPAARGRRHGPDDPGRYPAGRSRGAPPPARSGRAADRRGRDRSRSEHAVVQPHAGIGRAEGQAVPAARRVPPRDRLRDRPRRHRQHAVSRRRGPDLRTGQPRQRQVVFRRGAEVSPRSRARQNAARGPRPHRQERRRHARGRGGEARAVLDRHAGRQHPRADRDDDPGAAPPVGHPGRCRRARSLVNLRPFRPGGLREHLLRLPGELVRPGDEPGLLVERRLRARVEPGGAGAVGARDRRSDAAPGRGRDPRRTAAPLRRGAEDLRREPAGDLFRGAEDLGRHQQARRRRRPGAPRPEDPLESRHALRHGA